MTAGSPIRRGRRTRCCTGCSRPTWRPAATAGRLVNDADLGRRDEQRARVLVDNLMEALSPSNVPLVNPASAKAAVDTGGMNFVRGGVSLLQDMASAPRVPQMVDGSSFQVGENIAATPGCGGPAHRAAGADPVPAADRRPFGRCRCWSCPPTINKYYALDLAPGRSLVEYLVRSGPAGLRRLVAQPGRPARRLGPGHLRAGGPRRARRDRSASAGTDQAVLIGLLLRRNPRRLAAAHLAATGRRTGWPGSPWA